MSKSFSCCKIIGFRIREVEIPLSCKLQTLADDLTVRQSTQEIFTLKILTLEIFMLKIITLEILILEILTLKLGTSVDDLTVGENVYNTRKQPLIVDLKNTALVLHLKCVSHSKCVFTLTCLHITKECTECWKGGGQR